MELTSTRTLNAPIATVWAALNDPDTLKACIPGCETFEKTDDGYRVGVQARVGPVSARFNGKVTLADVVPPTAYTLRFEGQGGAAGFANGEARVTLTAPTAATTALAYAVKAQIGGKLAQIGSRLVDGAAAKMADDFFARFVERVAPAAEDAEATVAADVAEEPAVPVRRRDGSKTWTRYIAIAAIIVLLAWMYTHKGHF